MKLFDGVDCMFGVAIRILNFIVFRRRTSPLGSILGLVVVESRVDDFVEFVFVFSFDLNKRRGFLYLRGKLVVFVGFEE